MYDNDFEKFPGSKVEKSGERVVPEEQDFTKSYEKGGVPEFAGDKFGMANETNEYYGETVEDEEYDDDMANASALINYGLNAASREMGVEAVMQGIKSFDSAGSDDPIGDLFRHLGVNTNEELDDIKDESYVSAPEETEFRNESGMPKEVKKTKEGAFKAIEDMKELISEVEGADPRYDELRHNARSAGMGYFEYAVKDFGVRSLVELFDVLREQREQADEDETDEEEKSDEEELENGEAKEEEVFRIEREDE